MKKKFNITGVCYPHLHYMMDNSAKLAQAMEMVESGEYFIINRPRQYGKTTTLFFLHETLSKMEGYLPIRMNFQGIDEQWHESDGAFANMFIGQLQKALKFVKPELAVFLKELAAAPHDMNTLSDAITGLAHKVGEKLVLLIDEVDASSNFQPFLSFLGMLRTKYLDRFSPQHATFHSIVLAGVHDIKNLKSRVRPDERTVLNSPWNIASDFKVDMSFSPAEIAPMLVEYAQAEGVEMDVPAIAEKLHYYTSGYPFLVSKLCKTIAEDILPQKMEKRWTMEDLEQSVQLLLRENNTNFDSLIKNLENNEELYNLTFSILIEGSYFSFNIHNPLVFTGHQYGIFTNGYGVKIHNRIYQQLIFNYMTSRMETSLSKEDTGNRFEVAEAAKGLDLELLLLKFQQFMKEQYRKKDEAFLEREGRLIFLAYLHPILNGGGHTFVEPQISEEKRLDIAVTYFQHKYVIELKRWYGPEAHKEGLGQLAGYLDRQHLQKGFLIIFEHRTKKTWRTEHIRHQGKELFAVWV